MAKKSKHLAQSTSMSNTKCSCILKDKTKKRTHKKQTNNKTEHHNEEYCFAGWEHSPSLKSLKISKMQKGFCIIYDS